MEWQIKPKVLSWSVTIHGAEMPRWETYPSLYTRLKNWRKPLAKMVCYWSLEDSLELARLRMREDETRQFFGLTTPTEGEE